RLGTELEVGLVMEGTTVLRYAETDLPVRLADVRHLRECDASGYQPLTLAHGSLRRHARGGIRFDADDVTWPALGATRQGSAPVAGIVIIRRHLAGDQLWGAYPYGPYFPFGSDLTIVWNNKTGVIEARVVLGEVSA